MVVVVMVEDVDVVVVVSGDWIVSRKAFFARCCLEGLRRGAEAPDDSACYFNPTVHPSPIPATH
jgi:hypothetical protein